MQSHGFVHMKDELEKPHKLRLLSFSQENWPWNVKRENCRETMEIIGYLNATSGMNSPCLRRDAGIKQGKLLWKTQKTLRLFEQLMLRRLIVETLSAAIRQQGESSAFPGF